MLYALARMSMNHASVSRVLDRSYRRRAVCIVILCWQASSLQLAFDEARLSSDVVWIGCLHTVAFNFVSASMKEERVDELHQLTKDMMSGNVIAIKSLRAYTGNVTKFAAVLIMWRPFLDVLWVALCQSESNNGAPPRCVRTKQGMHTLNCICAFLCDKFLAMSRKFELSAWERGRPGHPASHRCLPTGL